MKKHFSSIVFAVIWLLFVTVLLCIPGTRLPKFNWDSKLWFDKLIHFVLFMILVILWSMTYYHKKKTPGEKRKTLLQLTILGFLYGILMELTQKYFIPYRSFDLFDVTANGLGCLAGYFFALKKFLPGNS